MYIDDLYNVFQKERTRTGGIVNPAKDLTLSTVTLVYNTYKEKFNQYGKYVNGTVSDNLVTAISGAINLEKWSVTQILFLVRVLGGGSTYSNDILARYNLTLKSAEWETPGKPQAQPASNPVNQQSPNAPEFDPKIMWAILSYIFM